MRNYCIEAELLDVFLRFFDRLVKEFVFCLGRSFIGQSNITCFIGVQIPKTFEEFGNAVADGLPSFLDTVANKLRNNDREQETEDFEES